MAFFSHLAIDRAPLSTWSAGGGGVAGVDGGRTGDRTGAFFVTLNASQLFFLMVTGQTPTPLWSATMPEEDETKQT